MVLDSYWRHYALKQRIREIPDYSFCTRTSTIYAVVGSLEVKLVPCTIVLMSSTLGVLE